MVALLSYWGFGLYMLVLDAPTVLFDRFTAMAKRLHNDRSGNELSGAAIGLIIFFLVLIIAALAYTFLHKSVNTAGAQLNKVANSSGTSVNGIN